MRAEERERGTLGGVCVSRVVAARGQRWVWTRTTVGSEPRATASLSVILLGAVPWVTWSILGFLVRSSWMLWGFPYSPIQRRWLRWPAAPVLALELLPGTHYGLDSRAPHTDHCGLR